MVVMADEFLAESRWSAGLRALRQAGTHPSAQAHAERYGELLRAVFAHAPPACVRMSLAGARGDELLALVADHIADAYSEIRVLPRVRARLEAVRHTFFADTDATEIHATARGYEFHLRECPAGALALECRDLCRLARAVLKSLTGCPVEQSQWISRGDPRCAFEILTARKVADP
jgi:predicted ArsR family transcriptional regulator